SEKQCRDQFKDMNKSCDALLFMLNQKVRTGSHSPPLLERECFQAPLGALSRG
ncbi:PLVAP isoform 3, partial [Pan troglodytes]